MLLRFPRGRTRRDASVPRTFDFHCSREARRLVNLGLVALHIVHLSLDLMPELGAIELGHGALHKPSVIVDAVDHGSHVLGLVKIWRGEHRHLRNADGARSVHEVRDVLHLFERQRRIVDLLHCAGLDLVHELAENLPVVKPLGNLLVTLGRSRDLLNPVYDPLLEKFVVRQFLFLLQLVIDAIIQLGHDVRTLISWRARGWTLRLKSLQMTWHLSKGWRVTVSLDLRCRGPRSQLLGTHAANGFVLSCCRSCRLQSKSNCGVAVCRSSETKRNGQK